MRSDWAVRSFVGIAAVASALAMIAPVMAASSPVSKTLEQRFLAIDGSLSKSSATWTTAVAAVPASASQAQISTTLNKVSPPFAAALQTFDKQLAALALPGHAGADALAVIKDDKQLRTLLGSAGKMTKSQFGKAFSGILTEELPLQKTFSKDLGLPATASIVI